MHHDIAGEHARGQILRQRSLDWFARNGVPPLHLAKDWEGIYGFVNTDEVVFTGSRFDFGRHVRGGQAQTAFTFVVWNEAGEAVDIAAWKPPHLALWIGCVAMLGQEQIFLPRMGDPLAVHPSPLEWFRAQRQGVVILDHQEAAPLLRTTGTLAVMDERHARELRQLLTTPPPLIVAAEVKTESALAA